MITTTLSAFERLSTTPLAQARSAIARQFDKVSAASLSSAPIEIEKLRLLSQVTTSVTPVEWTVSSPLTTTPTDGSAAAGKAMARTINSASIRKRYSPRNIVSALELQRVHPGEDRFAALID